MQAYKLVTLEPYWGIDPLGLKHLNWYLYVISNGINPVTGYRCGSRAEVMNYVDQNIKRLNQKYDIKGTTSLLHKHYIKPCHVAEHTIYS